jgi:ADP-ribosylglycohydrolase
MARVEEAVRITNNNELAVSGARCAAAALFKLLHGVPLAQALSEALSFAGRRLEPLLAEALAMPQLDSVAAAERFGASCHVSEGLPLVFHIAQRAPDYRSAVESNIRAGGDSCGRSIMLGAIATAHDSMRNPTEFPIPLSWLARYWKFEGAAEACAAL